MNEVSVALHDCSCVQSSLHDDTAQCSASINVKNAAHHHELIDRCQHASVSVEADVWMW
jgi:hypothetical protein